MISEKVFHLSKVPLPNSKTSPENNNMILVMSNSQFDTWQSTIPSWFTYNHTQTLNHQQKEKQRQGKTISKTLGILKKLEEDPFIKSEKVVDVTQAMIQSVTSKGTFICSNTILMKSQLTLSYAFSRSIFTIKESNFLVFTKCKHSCVTLIASRICVFVRIPNCCHFWLDIVRIFVIIL